ncbi:WAT1-related protein At5g40240-like [Glycine soja]|nr:WAT1-related protein At5g40240 [Glycine max]XP_028234129.1 WAT1-related protein At5g40240-like [Glycine soja]|eukprot:XP_006580643.1 WAT1-related protein At5g40240 [Glycine max]
MKSALQSFFSFSLSAAFYSSGTVLSIAGALLVTLYKGSPIISFRTQPSPTQPLPPLLAETSNWVIGGLFFATASISLAAWNITQAAILKGYSSQLTILAYYCLFGTIQSAILSLIVVRDPNDWKISPDIDLIAVFYSAVVGSVVTFSVNTWCIKKKGPVFVSLFKPVGIAIAAFSTVVFLGETLHVGSVVGAVIIAIGFYTVLWAQSKGENAKGFQVDGLSSPSAQASPLLEFHESNVLA